MQKLHLTNLRNGNKKLNKNSERFKSFLRPVLGKNSKFGSLAVNGVRVERFYFS